MQQTYLESKQAECDQIYSREEEKNSLWICEYENI